MHLHRLLVILSSQAICLFMHSLRHEFEEPRADVVAKSLLQRCVPPPRYDWVATASVRSTWNTRNPRENRPRCRTGA
jgi:hypothetical protein